MGDDLRVPLPCDEAGPDGPAVVLLHAGIADRRMWTDLLPELAAAGYRAVAPDLPGFGEAELVPGRPPYREVLETMDAVGVRDAVLVGNSFGGDVALRVAAAAPGRLRGLVLVSTPPVELRPSPELERAWEAEAAALERGDIDAAVRSVVDAWTLPGAPAALKERVAAMQRRAFEHQLGAEEDDGPDPLETSADALREIATDVLVAVGEFDMPDFRDGARELAALFERADIVTIGAAGHLAPLEQPAAFRDLLLGYLREHAPV